MVELNMLWIDTHAHLPHIQQRGVEIDEFVNGHQYALIDIGTRPGDLKSRLKLKGQNRNLAFSAGLYPDLAQLPQKELEVIWEEFEKDVKSHLESLCAIGEFGFDFHHQCGTASQQRALAQRQIQLAQQLDLPIIIHTRNADKETLALLRDFAPVKGVIHCCSSPPETTKHFLECGMFLSFCGNLTYKNAQEIRESAQLVPLDRVVFETDSPYLAPVPVRGTVNTPANVEHVYRFFSQLRGVPLPYLQKQVAENVTTLFGPIFQEEI